MTLASLDPAHDGLKIVQLSDIHVGTKTPAEHVRHAIAAAVAEKPDITVLTGDFIDHGEKAIALIPELLRGIPGQLVAVLGNHDHWTNAREVTRRIEALGCTVLSNRWTSLRVKNAELRIVGVDDALTGHADMHRASRGLPAGGAPVWLTHIPEVADSLLPLACGGLILSGHTHGGQVHLPVITPALARLVRKRYLHGFYGVRGALLYVNRGVGVSGLPVRFGVEGRAEVASFTLRAEA